MDNSEENNSDRNVSSKPLSAKMSLAASNEMEKLKTERSTAKRQLTILEKRLMELMKSSGQVNEVRTEWENYNGQMQQFLKAHEDYENLLTTEDAKLKAQAYLDDIRTKESVLDDKVGKYIAEYKASERPDKAKTVKSRSSKRTTKSIKLAAQKAALEAEAEALREQNEIEKQILQLQQRSKQLQLERDIAKLNSAIQIENEQESDEKSDDETSSDGEEQTRARVEDWLKSAQKAQTLEDEDKHNKKQKTTMNLNPLAAEFSMKNSHVSISETNEQRMLDLLETIKMPQSRIVRFDGDPINYWVFIRSFDNNVGRYNIDEHAKLSRLVDYCEENVQKVIRGCLAMKEGGYVRARKLLEERYGNRYVICNAWIDDIVKGDKIKISTLQKFADELRGFKETMAATDNLKEVNQRVLAQITERLPEFLVHRWRRIVVNVRSGQQDPDLEDLVSLVERAASEANDPVFGNQKKEFKEAKQSFKQNRGSSRSFHIDATITNSAERKKCCVCESSSCNTLFKCDAFRRMPPEKRLEVAANNRLCFNCLKRGHSSKECRSESTCTASGCKLKHTKFLHVSKASGTEGKGQTEASSTNGAAMEATCSHVNTKFTEVALPIVEVKVSIDGKDPIKTYALLDSGSTSTFCSSKLTKQLGSKGEETSLCLTTLEMESRITKATVHQLTISDIEGKNTVCLENVIARKQLPLGKTNLPTQSELNKWKHLKGLCVATCDTDREIHLLIGQDAPELLMPLEIRGLDSKGSPYAVRTLLGWTINGPVSSSHTEQISAYLASSISLEEQIKAFWHVDNNLADETKGPSVEDIQALNIMKNTIRSIDGHYSVAIPFRGMKDLPLNKITAEKRLNSLKKRFQHNSKLKAAYQESMNEFINDHAEEVQEADSEEKKGGVWYLPHHPVINQNKSKIRIVFDCAAKHQNVALNDKVLQGPDLTNDLLGVLLRFREFPIAIKGDIQAMFHQVKVPPEDRDILRFLWWRDGNTETTPTTYRMTAHPFGGTWSPSVCSYALQQTARDNKEQYHASIVEAVTRDFYVDDLLKSVATEEEASKFIKQLTELLSKGGFRLHKWQSNSTKVLESIEASERATTSEDLNVRALPVERTLGIKWNLESDAFTCSVGSIRKPMTRRGMLATVCSVYDPLGLLSPFTIRGKKLIQDQARTKQGWDEPLNEKQLDEWQCWLKELESLEQLQVDRVLMPKDFGKITNCQLHHFADASTMAYGAMSYIRIVNTDGDIHCAMVISKSRVTPIKQMTIPRLELMAAALAVKLDKLLKKQLSLKVDQSFFWTDSMIVLSYINNVEKRFHTFVANRLAIIHEDTTVDQWRHIESSLNPADDISRGLTVKQLKQGQWYHGPKFLWEKIPDKSETSIPVLDNDPEVKQKATVCLATAESIGLDKVIVYHSSWYKLKRSVAWLRRFVKFLRIKADSTKIEFKAKLEVEELQQAEKIIVSHVQRRTYREEIQTLSRNEPVKRRSVIAKLDPILENGLLVCNNRMKYSKVQELSYSPAIIPREHHLAKLIVLHCHEHNMHSGREHTVADVQKRFWIPGVRRLVRKLLNRCFTCRRIHARPAVQRMADLPEERIGVKQPPFHNIGIDCFGPFMTKIGRRQAKRYGCIFTCLTTRAIHLEVLDSLETQSFLNGLQRFMARRGSPAIIRSDNGTNFVGAERELREYLSKSEIEWKFNPPGASHMGGAWERLIKSVKGTLAAVMTSQIPSDDTLSTMMCIVEDIINNRPLTTVSDDPRDPEPLTPNHLLRLGVRAGPQLGNFTKTDLYCRRKWRQVQYLADIFWQRWTREYAQGLRRRTKWLKKYKNFEEDDLVLIVDNMPRNSWAIGRIAQTHKGKDGLVRSVDIQTKTGLLTRPIAKLCHLEGSCQDIN